MTASFPRHLVSDVVLRDGSTVRVRPARLDDLTRVEDYLIGLSPETRRLRFWSLTVRVRPTRSSDVTRVEDYLIGLSPETRRLRFWSQAIDVGSARPHDRGRRLRRPSHVTRAPRRRRGSDDRRRPVHPSGGGGGRAEISLSVTDEFQGRGIGSILLGQLAQEATRHDITMFVADVLPENHGMINVFRASGFTVSIRAMPGSIEVEFPIRLTDEAIDQFEHRETEAAVNAMRTFLSPRSVAVIGASRDLRIDRRPALPQPADDRVQRSRVPGEPEGRRGPRRRGVPDRDGGPGRGRRRVRGRAGRPRRGRRTRVRRERRPGTGGDLGGIRRGRTGRHRHDRTNSFRSAVLMACGSSAPTAWAS